MRTLLVTGGCGFIGSNFIRRALAVRDDIKIINFDKLTYAGNMDNVAGLQERYPGRYIFVYGDICDFSAVSHTLNIYNPDYVINFAAESHVDRSIDAPALFVHTNSMGVVFLLKAIRANWGEKDWPSRKFIHVSTDEVYGSLPEGGHDVRFTEAFPLDPHNNYARSKAIADQYILSTLKTCALPVIISRSSNNYGPRQFPEKLIPLMILNALENKPLPVYGDGLNIRDWLYVDDHADALLVMLDKGRTGEVYNLGGGNEMRNIDLVRLILKIVGKPDSLIKHVADRPGHDRRYAMDTTKIRATIGWSPATQFEQGFAETVKWYVDNRQWLERIVNGVYRLQNATYEADARGPARQI